MNGKLKQFQRGTVSEIVLLSPEAFAKRFSMSVEEAQSQLARLRAQDIWLNDEYQVNVDKDVGHGFGDSLRMWHLSIKRLDKKPVHDWRDLQAIKNVIVDPTAEAIEIYPDDARLVDTVNQYHLWVFMSLRKSDGNVQMFPHVPCGYLDREVDYSTVRTNGTKQRGLT